MKAIWIVAAVLAAATTRAPVRPLPAITGYLQSGCVKQGDTLIALGVNLGEPARGHRVVLWAAGESIETHVVLWRDTEIHVLVPIDPRVVPGRSYRLRIETVAGQPLGSMGPPLIICTEQAAAESLGDAVFKASGGWRWPKVRRIRFTFNLEQDGKLLVSASHDCNLRAGTDTVRYNDKTVTVNLRQPGDCADARAAFARWVSDSFWLLAPLRLREPGVRVRPVGEDSLEVSFDNAGPAVAGTYVFQIDRRTNLPRACRFVTAAGEETTATWERYRRVGGLTLSTEHNLSGQRIFFTDISVETD